MINIEEGILIASSNKAKIKEIKAIFSDISSFKIYSLNDLNFYELNIVEDGKTFKQNAYKKAYSYALEYKICTLADDSGLEVDYLGGEPGVLSARYAGPNATDKMLSQKLLDKLEGVSKTQRTACFKSVVCLYDYFNQQNIFSEGVLQGSISLSQTGINGFGYDPIFIPNGINKTLAELSEEEKNKISHRYKALSGLKLALEEFFI
jgi:XTP/dITP diphosphohydrolase